MYIDEVVLAGLIIVTLTIMFFGGFIWAIRKDIQRRGGGQTKTSGKAPHSPAT